MMGLTLMAKHETGDGEQLFQRGIVLDPIRPPTNHGDIARGIAFGVIDTIKRRRAILAMILAEGQGDTKNRTAFWDDDVRKRNRKRNPAPPRPVSSTKPDDFRSVFDPGSFVIATFPAWIFNMRCPLRAIPTLAAYFRPSCYFSRTEFRNGEVQFATGTAQGVVHSGTLT